MFRIGHWSSAKTSVLALLAVSVAILAVTCDDDRGSTGGVAFESDPQLHQMAGFHADAGQTVVFGATVVDNSGTTPATLTSATLVGEVSPEDAAVGEVRALDPAEHNGDLVGAAPWPFEDYAEPSRPLDGYQLRPGREVELLFIVDVKKTGTWTWSATSLSYEQDGESHTTTVNFGFQVCPTNIDQCDT